MCPESQAKRSTIGIERWKRAVPQYSGNPSRARAAPGIQRAWTSRHITVEHHPALPWGDAERRVAQVLKPSGQLLAMTLSHRLLDLCQFLSNRLGKGQIVWPAIWADRLDGGRIGRLGGPARERVFNQGKRLRLIGRCYHP